jgi:PIN domain nuclease of toxin-antitoxin system
MTLTNRYQKISLLPAHELLLDTHAFIWWDGDPLKLSPRVLALCKDPTNDLVFSVASAWEIQIKIQLGKLSLRLALQDIVREQQRDRMDILPITLAHVYELQQLPRHHGDPFDRLLIAQAHVEGMALISHDHVFQQYIVNVVW